LFYPYTASIPKIVLFTQEEFDQQLEHELMISNR